jgi:ectoine hydroxylase
MSAPNLQDDLYPSRNGGNARLAERLDPVIHGADGDCPLLHPAQTDAYTRKGYLVADRLFDADEVRALSGELQRLRSASEHANDEAVIREPDGNAIRSIFEVHKTSAMFARLVCDARLVSVAEHLLGGEVYVHQSRLNYKPGFLGKEFYWHSDFETWHVEDGMPRMRALSVSISLTDNFDANGPLMLVPGSHLKYVVCPGETPEDHYRESLRQQQYGVPPDKLLRELVEQGGIDSITGPAGSATFFDCNTMHGSNSNISPLPRANAFIVYNSVRNRLEEPYGTSAPRPDFLAERHDFKPLSKVAGKIR